MANIVHTTTVTPGTATLPTPNVNAVALSALTPTDAEIEAGSNTQVNRLYGYNPKRYSGKLLRKFYEQCVLAKISCTDYIGEIKDYGDTVIIRTTPDIQVHDWKKGQVLSYETLDSDTVELTIDKAKYWAFVTDPLDEKQTDIKSFVNNWTTDAAKRIDIAIEKEVFKYLYGANAATEAGNAIAAAANKGATAGRTSASYNLGTETAPITITTQNAIAKINDCGSVMMEQDQSPDEGFWMVIDQKYANVLASSELRLSYAMGNGTSLELRGGQNAIPKLDIFDIHTSNIMPQVVGTEKSSSAVNTSAVFFGNKLALCFAMQLTKNEVITNPDSFGLLHRGLAVYGFKVIQPKYLGIMLVKYGDTVPAPTPVTVEGTVATKEQE